MELNLQGLEYGCCVSSMKWVCPIACSQHGPYVQSCHYSPSLVTVPSIPKSWQSELLKSSPLSKREKPPNNTFSYILFINFNNSHLLQCLVPGTQKGDGIRCTDFWFSAWRTQTSFAFSKVKSKAHWCNCNFPFLISLYSESKNCAIQIPNTYYYFLGKSVC